MTKIPQLALYSEKAITGRDTCTPVFVAVLLQYLGHGSHLDVHGQINGYRNCGTYPQWDITQL